jgi:hypothetical protein
MANYKIQNFLPLSKLILSCIVFVCIEKKMLPKVVHKLLSDGKSVLVSLRCGSRKFAGTQWSQNRFMTNLECNEQSLIYS